MRIRMLIQMRVQTPSVNSPDERLDNIQRDETESEGGRKQSDCDLPEFEDLIAEAHAATEESHDEGIKVSSRNLSISSCGSMVSISLNTDECIIMTIADGREIAETALYYEHSFKEHTVVWRDCFSPPMLLYATFN